MIGKIIAGAALIGALALPVSAMADETGTVGGATAGVIGGPIGAVVGGIGGAVIGNSVTDHHAYYRRQMAHRHVAPY
jgi:hypothetical protein